MSNFNLEMCLLGVKNYAKLSMNLYSVVILEGLSHRKSAFSQTLPYRGPVRAFRRNCLRIRVSF